MAREHGKGMTLLFHQYISNKKTKNQNRSAFTMHRPHECAFISVHLFFQWKLKYPSIHTMEVFSLSVLEAKKKKKKKIVARKQTTGMFNVAMVLTAEQHTVPTPRSPEALPPQALASGPTFLV